MKKIFTLGIVFFTLNACYTKQNLLVKEEKVACNDNSKQCFQIKTPHSQEWQTYPFEIKGFDYQEGNQYLIEVKKRNNQNEKSNQYRYIKTISQESITAKPTPPDMVKEIDINNTWEVQNISSFPNTTNKKPYFTINQHQINGNTSCNNFGGVVNIDSNTIKINNLTMTKMFCNETADVEFQFVTVLENVASYQINYNELLFFDSDSNLLMQASLKESVHLEKSNTSLEEEILKGNYIIQYQIAGRRFSQTWTYHMNHLEVNATLPEIQKNQIVADKTNGKNITNLVSKLNFSELEQLMPPSIAHQYDGAYAASFTIIVNGKSFVAPTFDEGNPPAQIKEIVDLLYKLRKK